MAARTLEIGTRRIPTRMLCTAPLRPGRTPSEEVPALAVDELSAETPLLCVRDICPVRRQMIRGAKAHASDSRSSDSRALIIALDSMSIVWAMALKLLDVSAHKLLLLKDFLNCWTTLCSFGYPGSKKRGAAGGMGTHTRIQKVCESTWMSVQECAAALVAHPVVFVGNNAWFAQEPVLALRITPSCRMSC